MAGYNEFNLQVTRQQSKINALKQELDFKSNQLNDLQVQIESECITVETNAGKHCRKQRHYCKLRSRRMLTCCIKKKQKKRH